MLVKPVVSKRPRVEMVPLIDMFFLLLIFFIFGVFSMTTQEGLIVDLPQAQTGAALKDNRTITVSVTAEGELAVNRQPATLQTLPAALEVQRGERREPLVVINADRAASHGVVIGVLDAVRQVGLQRVSFQTTPEQP